MKHFLDTGTHHIKNLRSAPNAPRQFPVRKHPSGSVTPIYAVNCGFASRWKGSQLPGLCFKAATEKRAKLGHSIEKKKIYKFIDRSIRKKYPSSAQRCVLFSVLLKHPNRLAWCALPASRSLWIINFVHFIAILVFKNLWGVNPLRLFWAAGKFQRPPLASGSVRPFLLCSEPVTSSSLIFL